MPIPTDFLDSQPPGPTTDKSVAYLSRADSDTLAYSCWVKWIKRRYLIKLFANMLPRSSEGFTLKQLCVE